MAEMTGHRVYVRDCGDKGHLQRYGSEQFHLHVLNIVRCDHGRVRGTGCNRCER